MSTISNALNKWLQRQQNISVMRQEVSVCEMLPPATKDKMINISEASAMYPGEYKPEKVRERGAPITQDYTLGDVKIGTRDRVAIPRPPGTLGTYHTHPWGSPFPSHLDTVDAMDKDDKLMCIGATGKAGTKIQCFTPNKPKWSDLQYKFRLLADDIKDYNKRIGAKFKGTRAEIRLKVSQSEPELYTEGKRLEARKSVLLGEIKSELRRLAYPKDWQAFKHGEYVPYFEAFPNMLTKCRIIYEGFEEDLPYEL